MKLIINTLSAMAQGLFASLLIGTILSTIGQQTNIPSITEAGQFAMSMAGPAMAVAIAHAMKAAPLVLFASAAVGAAANTLGGAGGPLAVYIVTLLAVFSGKFVSGKTRIDIIITPLVTIGVGIALAKLTAPSIGHAANSVGTVIMWATEQQPFVMGVVVAVVMGICLTLPISSAAICAALGLTGLAGGAALAGCCAQMVGFAVLSFKDNKWSGLLSQGIGTSMLQMGNIIKNPRIWIAPIIASAVAGAIATCLFHLEMNGPAISSGMGTCGLVGPIGVYTGWVEEIANGTRNTISVNDWLQLACVTIIIPAIVTPLAGIVLKRMKWIKPGDMKL